MRANPTGLVCEYSGVINVHKYFIIIIIIIFKSNWVALLTLFLSTAFIDTLIFSMRMKFKCKCSHGAKGTSVLWDTYMYVGKIYATNLYFEFKVKNNNINY